MNLSKMRAAAVLLLAAAATACGGGGSPASSSSFSLDVGISPTPATVGTARVIATLADSTGGMVDDAFVTVTAVRPGGDPGSLDTARARAPGRYVAPAVVLDRPGEWRIDVRASLPDMRFVESRHRLVVVTAP